MDNIINTILKIENEAKHRISSAEEKSSDIMRQTKLKSSEIKNKIKSDTEKKAEEIEKNESIKISKAKEEIDRKCSEKYQALENIYNVNHLEWENEIFQRIVGE